MEDVLASEFGNVLQLARSLVDEKTEFNQTYFEQFIQPAWSAFVKVHNNYDASFKGYVDFVTSDGFRFEVLLKRIQHDSIQAQNLRTDLVGILAHVPSLKFQIKRDLLLDSIMLFIMSVEEYLGDRGVVGASFEINCGRNDGKPLKKFLNETLLEIEGQYQKVASEYKRLSISILT